MRIYGTSGKHLWYPKWYRYHSLRTAVLESTRESYKVNKK
jgi:hypothetical protein